MPKTKPKTRKAKDKRWLKDIFVASKDGTFTCGPCLTEAERKHLGDDEVEVWDLKTNAHGWTPPVICHRCKLCLPVYVDAPEALLTKLTLDEAERVLELHEGVSSEPREGDDALVAKGWAIIGDSTELTPRAYGKHDNFDVTEGCRPLVLRADESFETRWLELGTAETK